MIDIAAFTQDKLVSYGMTGSAYAVGLGIIVFVARILWKNERARRALGVGLGLDEKPDASLSELNKVLIHFVQAQDARSTDDRKERARQWERIEQMVGVIREQAKETHDLATSMNAIGQHFQQLYSQNENTLQRIEHSQVNLAIWIYQNLGGNRIPSQPNQQMPAQAGGR